MIDGFFLVFFPGQFLKQVSSQLLHLSLRQSHCRIKHGYFIDEGKGVRFKLPPHSHVDGLHATVDMAWEQASPVFSTGLFKVSYTKLATDATAALREAAERTVRDFTGFKDLEVKVLSKDQPRTMPYGVGSRVVFSKRYVDGEVSGQWETLDIRYIVKGSFLIEAMYGNETSKYQALNQRELDRIFKELFISFTQDFSGSTT